MTYSKLRFSKFKKLALGAPIMQISLNFKTFSWNLKIRSLGAKLCVAFYYFYFKRNYVVKSKSPCFMLNRNVKLNKNETESKIENPTNNFREMNHNISFVWRKSFNICILSQCTVYWINFQNIYTFTYQKTLLIHFCWLFLKSLKPSVYT